MTSRKDRPKSAFTSDERGLGGAHQILSDYMSHYRRIEDAKPSRAILETKKIAGQSMAHRLSSNRAARIAAVSTTAVEHFSNVYHLNRRIEACYSTSERRKDPYDPSLYPAYQKRGSNLYKSSLHASLIAPWAPEAATTSSAFRPSSGGGGGATLTQRRPGSAPATRGRRRGSSGGGGDGGDGYQGFGLTANLRDAYPSDDFPLHASYKSVAQDSIYVAYKRAIMAEIIENRMYREADLKDLFRSYRRLAPLRDKDAVERVVEDLGVELDVRGGGGGRGRH